MIINFIKMQALRNDFIIINKKVSFNLTPQQITFLCHRNFGIGADQLILYTENKNEKTITTEIYNSDGSKAEACGNVFMCLGKFFAGENKWDNFEIISYGKVFKVSIMDNLIAVNMGVAIISEKPLNNSSIFGVMDNHMIDYSDGIVVDVGNPHVVFFDVTAPYLHNLAQQKMCIGEKMGVILDKIYRTKSSQPFNSINLESDIKRFGATIAKHSSFSKGVNVEFAQVIDKHTIEIQVWERGSGYTLACGSGACATFAVALNEGLVGESCKIRMRGGDLKVSRNAKKEIIMTGGAEYVFTGNIQI